MKSSNFDWLLCTDLLIMRGYWFTVLRLWIYDKEIPDKIEPVSESPILSENILGHIYA